MAPRAAGARLGPTAEFGELELPIGLLVQNDDDEDDLDDDEDNGGEDEDE